MRTTSGLLTGLLLGATLGVGCGPKVDCDKLEKRLNACAKEMILKVVNAVGEPFRVTIEMKGVKAVGAYANVTTLASDGLIDENSFETPEKIAPVTSRAPVRSAEFRYDFRPYSLTIIRLMCERQ